MTPKPTRVVGRRVAGYLLDSLAFSVLTAIAWFALTDRFDSSSSTGGGFVIGDTRYAFSSSSNRTIWLTILVLLWLAIFVVLRGCAARRPGGPRRGSGS